jgi:hypothetical protein
MRSSCALFALPFAFAAACGGTEAGDDDVPVDAPVNPGSSFRITTPDITIEPGQEVTYCYYTTIQTTAELGVKKWSSSMTPGSHHLILYFGDSGKPDGTIDQSCGGGAAGGVPYWMYSAQTPTNEAVMPTGIGMTVPAGQKAYVQMHYLNTGDAPIQAHVVIDAETYAAGEAYTPAAAFITFNTQINIPPNATASAMGTCSVPAGAKFFAVSTHAHKQAVHTEVRDGAAMVFQSDNWEHPGQAAWTADPFFSFGTGSLTYRCDYNNPTNRTIRTGDSAATDEMCMAVGYFFPATGPKFCINSTTF